ncbi:MAG: universal stress protein [Myxococcales bacterium]|jgi:nucleotide-binding universal stress UspA family protein
MAAKHILACIDFSEQSTRALGEIGQYARANGSKVTLIHVLDPRAFTPPQAVLEPSYPESEDTDEAELAKLRDEHLSGVDVELALVQDHAPARAICDYAEEHDVDLIVLGSHGRGGMEHWLIGSVAERVVRHAKANVYVVRR